MPEFSVHFTRDRRPWFISLLLFSVYLLVYSGQFHSADEVSILSMTETLAKVGWFDTPQRAFEIQVGLPVTQGFEGVDGRIYSKKGWSWPAFLIPFYALSLLSSRLGGLQIAHLAPMVVTSITGALVYWCGRQLRFSPRTSLWGAFIFGLGSIALVYSRFLFAEPFVGLCLTGAVCLAMRSRHRQVGSWPWSALGGFLFGLASAARIPTLALAPVFVGYLIWHLPSRGTAPIDARTHWRRVWLSALAFGVGAAIPLLLSGVYNWIALGSPLQSTYQSDGGFTTPVWDGLYGLLISPGKGFFWYSPVLLLALPGTVILWRRNKSETLLIWGLAAGTVLMYSMWYMWWGGTAWGPRFLVPLAAPLTLLCMPAIAQARKGRGWAFVLVALFGTSIAVQILGSVVNFLHYGASMSALVPQFEWTLAIHDIRYQPIWGHLQLLQPEHLDLSWVGRMGTEFVVDWWSLAAYGGMACASGVALAFASKRDRSRWVLPVLVVSCVGTVACGQVRLHAALAASPGARQWQLLYEQVASSAKSGDVIFLQDQLGAETGFWFDRSRTRRYNWSPRPIPLDPGSQGLMERSAADRVWLATGQPAAFDPDRGIERWLLEHSAKLIDEQIGEGARLVLFERTPSAMVEIESDLLFADQVVLLHYAYPEESVAPGQAIHLVLTWQAVQHPDFNYSVFVHLLAPSGQIVQQIDGSPVGGMVPMSMWHEGQVVVDRYALLPSKDLPAGPYRLLVGVYRWETLERLKVVDTHGNQVGDAVDLGEISLRDGSGAGSRH